MVQLSEFENLFSSPRMLDPHPQDLHCINCLHYLWSLSRLESSPGQAGAPERQGHTRIFLRTRLISPTGGARLLQYLARCGYQGAVALAEIMVQGIVILLLTVC